MTQANAHKAAPELGTRAEAALRAFHEEGAFGKAYDTRLVARIWPYMRPHQGLLWLSIALGIVMAGLSLFRPYLMRITIDRGAIAKDPKVLLWGGAAFAS